MQKSLIILFLSLSSLSTAVANQCATLLVDSQLMEVRENLESSLIRFVIRKKDLPSKKALLKEMQKDKKSECGQDLNVRAEVPFCLMAHYDDIFWRKNKAGYTA